MYIKLKDGRIIQTIEVNPRGDKGLYWPVKGGVEGFPILEVESITDERPKLVTMKETEEALKPYLAWSHLNQNADEEFESITSIHDLMDFLAHTHRLLTHKGFVFIGGIQQKKKVQVVYSHMWPTSAVTVYRDAMGNEYFKVSQFRGVYSRKPVEDGMWDDHLIPDVELEIIKEFPSPLMHRDDRPGC
jgi:hypothetical protein